MTRKFLSTIVLALVVSAFCSLVVIGQVKSINLPKGKKVVLKGQVRAGGERLYTFEAKKGQRLTVRLISANKNAVFNVNVQYRIDTELIDEEKTEWSGLLPEAESGLYSIAVTTSAGTARYTLAITLR